MRLFAPTKKDLGLTSIAGAGVFVSAWHFRGRLFPPRYHPLPFLRPLAGVVPAAQAPVTQSKPKRAISLGSLGSSLYNFNVTRVIIMWGLQEEYDLKHLSDPPPFRLWPIRSYLASKLSWWRKIDQQRPSELVLPDRRDRQPVR